MQIQQLAGSVPALHADMDAGVTGVTIVLGFRVAEHSQYGGGRLPN
jgi:hypothetical protein